jgi:ubiquinone/menaquinone biosynthesis C-methylase UbiE
VGVSQGREFGMGRGKVFPARYARTLLHPLRRWIQSPRKTVARMALAKADAVLEIGCGPGYFSADIAAALPDGSLTLFDLQPEMLALAKQRLASFTNVRYVQGDAMTLPFADASFDGVLIVFMLGEVPDVERCLAEVVRVLKQGGSVTFGESRRDSDFIPFAKLQERVAKHGLKLAEKRGPPWEYTARFISDGTSLQTQGYATTI